MVVWSCKLWSDGCRLACVDTEMSDLINCKLPVGFWCILTNTILNNCIYVFNAVVVYTY